jgi:hypothetical protein
MHVRPPTSWNGTYAFDAVDAELRLLPMAARRALDVAGLHLSLDAWQGLPLAARQALVALGAGTTVDAAEVVARLAEAGAVSVEQPPLLDPPAVAPPPEVTQALQPARALDAACWAQLRTLDRYVLAQLARRGKLERLAAAYDEIVAAKSGS